MLSEIIIPNKEKFMDFLNNCDITSNYNIGIIANHGCCKSSICNLIIDFFLKDKNKDNIDKIIYKLNYYDDINLSNSLNSLNIFCQNNINSDKLIYIDNFDHFNETNQQLLKIYMDKYNLFKQKNKVFFLIESTNENKIKDIIKFRLKLYFIDSLNDEHLSKIILNISNKKKITITPDAIEELLKKINSSIYTIENFFDKMELMNIHEITTNIVKKNYNIFDYNIFNIYFSNIINNNLKEANKILFDLYDDGYDVSDIYFFLYDFIKQENKEEFYTLISLICYYINENYNGNYNKIFLIFLTFDIKKII